VFIKTQFGGDGSWGFGKIFFGETKIDHPLRIRTLREKTVVKSTIFDEKTVMDRKSSTNYSKI